MIERIPAGFKSILIGVCGFAGAAAFTEFRVRIATEGWSGVVRGFDLG